MERHDGHEPCSDSGSSTTSIASDESASIRPPLPYIRSQSSADTAKLNYFRGYVMASAEPSDRETSSTKVHVDPSRFASHASGTDILGLSTPPAVVARIASDKRKADALSTCTLPSSSSAQPAKVVDTNVSRPRKRLRLLVSRRGSDSASAQPEQKTTTTSRGAASSPISAWLRDQPDRPGDYANADLPPTKDEVFDPIREELDISKLAPKLPHAAIMASVQAIRNVEELLKIGFLAGSKYPMHKRRDRK
ncbi:hypothetical protein D7B24_003506 [Verticillium nonalfalfae]|uniref:Uncharacterized protein n=1 Tax=Verticillium nonalfalfae TaxID=1051616 RepID=A0A3M9YKG9_9PEZI|nr:uncharacterized protein D7B24_003506 [Verticillium nonalfalfae]RNJ61093.1 hypothetical protein D7B24_003506 [Verticillium nonalfalfae]